MGEVIEHNCGLCVAHTLHDTYSFIKSLQHRGRDAVGLCAIGDNRIDVIKWAGQVNSFDVTDLHKIFQRTEYHTYMAHVRYATRGKKDHILEDAHPYTIGGTREDRGTHVLIYGCDMAACHNGQVEVGILNGLDKSQLRTDCDTEALLHFYRTNGENGLMRRVEGSYIFCVADKRRKDVIVLRDRHGIKPACLGWKDGNYCVVSESIALRENGAEFRYNLIPGYAYYLKPDGSFDKEKIADSSPRHCFFEWNYIADQNSLIDQLNVRVVREMLGEKLAEEFNPKNIDILSYIPRCPEAAAEGYARKRNMEVTPLFYKMRSERSFLGSGKEARARSIGNNLYLLPGASERVSGKDVVVIDDSTIRGNVANRVRDLMNKSRAKSVCLANYTPMIGIVGEDGIPRGCLFGVDMPPDDSFIARNRTQEEISRLIGMPIYYLSPSSMKSVFSGLGMNPGNLCTYCIGGENPLVSLRVNGKEIRN